MTKRDFFRVIIKLFGLYSLILTIFTFIPANLSFVTYELNFFVVLLILGITFFIAMIYIFLIRKTDKIIDILKLDKGFDDDRIEIENFNTLNIIKLAVLLVGGFLIIDYFPEFLNHCFFAFKKSVSRNGLLSDIEDVQFSRIDYFNWSISVMNLVLGYLLLTNYDRITSWLTRNDTKEE